MDEVLREIPRVCEDLRFIPLVTPTSQIVGTRAVINVLAGERYEIIARKTGGLLKGEYGATAAPVDRDLKQRVLEGGEPITCRPADLLEPELDKLTIELRRMAADQGVKLAAHEIEDVLIYAMFPQVGWKFLQNSSNASAFEPAPGSEIAQPPVGTPEMGAAGETCAYTVTVNGRTYQVEVAACGAIASLRSAPTATSKPVSAGAGENVRAPMAGHILRINVKEGQMLEAGQVMVVMEAMKMETEVRVRSTGVVREICVKVADPVGANDVLVTVV